MTLRLVDKPAVKLNEVQTKQLMATVLAWEKADRDFYQKMLDSQKQLKGNQWPDGNRSSSQNRVTANLAYAMFKSALPFIFFKDPTVRSRPKTPLQVGKEVVWDGILNGTMPLIDYAKQKRLQVEDAWVYGEGWSKWVVSPNQEQEEDTNARGTVLSEIPKGPAKWHGKGLPVSIRLTPRQVIVDSEARGRDPDEARAIFVKYRRPLSEVLVDKRYKIDAKLFKAKQGRIKSKATADDGDFSETIRARLDDFFDTNRPETSKSRGGEDIITIYEGWVYQLVDFKLYRQLIVLMEDYPLPIMQPRPWEDFVGEQFPGWPIRKMEFNRVVDDSPTNNIAVTKNLQNTFNWVLSKLVNHVDTLNTVRTVNNESLKDVKKTMRQLRRGRALEYVEVSGPDAIANVSTPPFPADAYNLANILEGLIDRIGSGSKNRGGEIGARTATEVNVVEQAQRTMDDDTVDIVKSFLKDDMEQLSIMLRQMLTPDQVIKIAGDTGGIEFGKIDEGVLSNVPEVEIEIDSFRKVSVQEKLQPWMTIWQLAMQALPVMPDLRLDVILARISNTLDLEPGTFMGNLEDERLAELFDIMNLVQMAQEGGGAEDIPIPQDANPVVRLQMLEFFLASETAKRMGQGVLAVIQQRRMKLIEMVEFLKERQNQASSAGSSANIGQNPIDKGSTAPDAATRARSQTQSQLQKGGLTPGPRGVTT